MSKISPIREGYVDGLNLALELVQYSLDLEMAARSIQAAIESITPTEIKGN